MSSKSSKSSKSTQSSKSMSNIKSSTKDKEKEKEKEKESTSTSSPTKVTGSSSSSSNSFLYWKQKESSNNLLNTSSSNLNNLNTKDNNEPTPSPQTPKTSQTPKTPTKKPSIFSLGKKSGSEAISGISPDINIKEESKEDKGKSTTATSTTTTSSNSNTYSSHTLPNRMKSDRKSIRIFGLELFGKSEEEEVTEQKQPEEQQQSQSTPNSLESTPTLSSSSHISSADKEMSKSTKKPTSSTPKKIPQPSTNSVPASPSKSSLKQSSKSSLSVSNNNTIRKGSTPQPITTSSSLSFSTPTTSPNITSSSPTYKPILSSPKKVSPLLQSNLASSNTNSINSNNSTTSSGNVSPLSSSPNTTSTVVNENGFDDPFKNDVMLADDLDLSKLNSKVKSKAVERLLQLELITKILSKEIESVTGKLTNEISQRKDVEAGYKELEARLQIYEARWKRYSNNLSGLNLNGNEVNNNNNIILEEKEDEKIKLFKEERESQRISTLITRIDTLEKKVQSLEQNNRQLNEDIHLLHSETSLSEADKKKKLKKLEKEKEKEKEKEREKQKEMEKHLLKEKEKDKGREKELLKEQKVIEKQKQKEIKRSQTVPSNINKKELKDKEPRESKNLDDDRSEYTDSENTKTNSIINNIDINYSGSESELSTSYEKKSKKVFFGDDLDIINNMDDNNNSGYHHASSKSSTGGYSISSTVTLRKHAAKRLSAHISGTKGLLDDEIESLRKCVNDSLVSSEEKSNKVKGFFKDYYLDYNDIINEKKTRMRSKSLSKDKEEEALEKISTNFIFSNSSGSLSGSMNFNEAKENNISDIKVEKENNNSKNNNSPVSLTSSFDPNISLKEANSTPELASITPSRTANEKKRANTGYLTLGRMFKKDDTISILSDKLKDRKTRDELISNNIIKFSIFGTEVTDELFSSISEYFSNSFKVLLENRELEDLFKKEVEQNVVNEFIEKVESKLLINFDNQDPHVVATALIKYLTKLPTVLLSKISTTLINSVEFQSEIYRTSIIRSALFSLQPSQKNLLISLIKFLQEFLAEKVITEVIENESENNDNIVDDCENNKLKEENEDKPTKVEPKETTLASNSFVLNLFSKLLFDINSVNSQVDKQLISSQVLKYLIDDIEGFIKQQSHPDIVYLLKDSEVIVKAASLDKVIEKLFDITTNYKDPDYNYTIFYTYDYYTDSRSLLEKFVHYYRLLSSNDKQSLVIASVAMFWMKIHHNKLSTDLAFIHKLKDFTESVNPMPKLHTTIFAYFKTFFQKQTSSPLTLSTAVDIYSGKKGAKQEKSSKTSIPHLKGDHIDVYHLGPAIIAEQITSIDNDLLLAIPPSQFLHKSFTKYETSQQFHYMVDKFNEWAKFAASEILSKERLVDRTNALAFFIEVAKSCVELGNYNASSAIVGGLNHSSITRLKLTWEKLPTKVFQDYERLETLFDMSMNYKNYREELKSCSSKVIPYLGLFPKDLIAIEEGNDNKTSTGLINIEKFRLLYVMIKKIQSYQQPLFNIKISEPIKDYLHRIANHFIEEKDYYPLSLKLEPRANTQTNLSVSSVI